MKRLLSRLVTFNRGFRVADGDFKTKSELRCAALLAMKEITAMSANTQKDRDVTESASGVLVEELLDDIMRRDTLKEE